MTKSLRKKRTRKDLRIAEHAMPRRLVQLPAYATELWKPHRYKVLYGGRGGARSWTVARSLLLMASQKPLRILCAREIQSSIKDSVHQLLRDQIDIMQLTGYIVTDREIRHANGSLFIFAGLRFNATRIKSLEGIDICWVEEAERISKESWNILIPTIRKVGSEIWVTFNPDQESDATYHRLIIHTPKDTFKQKVSSWDNPWLPDVLKEERDYAYATDPDAADHVWGGNIRRFSAAQVLNGKYIVQEFTIDYDADGNPVDEAWHGPYCGCDFGFGTDPTAAIKAWVKGRSLYIEHEAYGHGVDIDDTPTLYTESIPGVARYTIRGDSARPDSISYLRRHGLPRTIGAVKGPGSVEDGVAHLRSYEYIIVHPRCKHTIDECKLWSYKVDRLSGDVLPVLVDKHNHLMDSLRYALEPLIKPRVRAGFIFLRGERQVTCPVCESRLPDDGECPHCGAFVDMATGLLIDDTASHAEESLAALTEFAHTTMVPPTNGNGHTNGNGTHDAPPAGFSRLFGINNSR
jgi:phage terminase large subunit